MYRSRYRKIVWFFGRVIASLVFWDLLLPRIGLASWSARGRSARIRNAAIRFRVLAISMGGVMIKVGQFLSTRVDILPREITNELAGLQDEVPPVQYDLIRNSIEREFNRPIEELYVSFNSHPLAAASLGQVHEASLSTRIFPQEGIPTNDGRQPSLSVVNVVVKVQRPDIENLIRTDLEALKTVGNWLQHYPPIRRRANVPALLDEFSRILYEEIDYLAEGRNAEIFAENFSGDPRVRVPKVYWSHTTVRVLTLENVYAIKIADYTSINEAGISRKEVATVLLDTYLKQIFEDGFFHADPHPGNLFVEPSPVPIPVLASERQTYSRNGQNGNGMVNWRLTFVDFGMVGRIPPKLRTGLRELLIGVGTRDSPRVIKAYQDMDVLLPGADLVMLERAESRIFDQFWGKNMSEITNLNINDLKDFASEFRDLLYDLPFQVPQDLIFLIRCVNILSGMCTGLDPQFNVFEHLAPYAKKLISDEARNNRKDWLIELQKIAQSWLTAPMKLDALLNKLDRGDISMRNPEVSQQVTRLERAVHSLGIGLIFAAFLLGGIQFYIDNSLVGATILFIGAFISLVWIILRNMISS